MRIALAQINPTVGDIEGNVARIIAYAGQARKELLRRWNEIANSLPKNEYTDEAIGMVSLYRVLLKEDRAWEASRADRGAVGTAEEQIAMWLYRLRDLAARQSSQPGSCRVVRVRRSSDGRWEQNLALQRYIRPKAFSEPRYTYAFLVKPPQRPATVGRRRAPARLLPVADLAHDAAHLLVSRRFVVCRIKLRVDRRPHLADAPPAVFSPEASALPC